jgi:hypothetical protein
VFGERLGGQLDLHWDVAKTRNGIDWPVGDDLIFADWFESGRYRSDFLSAPPRR